MKLCRISHPSFESARYAGLLGSNVYPLPADYNFGDIRIPSDEGMLHLADVKLLAPVVPSKIVCVGRNYREHAAELGNKMPDEPLLFLKAPSSVIGDGESIQLPPESERVEHEGELGVVIRRQARHIPDGEDPLSYVLGYTCVN